MHRFAAATLYPRAVLFVAIVSWAHGMLRLMSPLFVEGPTRFELLKQGLIGRLLAELPSLLFLPYQAGWIGWFAMSTLACVLVRPVGPAKRSFLVGTTVRTTSSGPPRW